MSFEYMGSPSLSSFSDELIKISSEGDEIPASEFQAARKQRIKRFVGDALVGAAGFGLGYGAGSAAGRLLAGHKPELFRSKWTPWVVGAAGMGAGLLHRYSDAKRQEYVDEPLNTPRNG